MTLILQTLRTPLGVPPETRKVGGGTFRVGRGADSDWTLPDPERVLSKRHCRLVEGGDGWLVCDTSSNGTVLNGRALVCDAPEPLRNGDRLALGTYEIEVQMVDEVGGVGNSESGDRQSTSDPFPFPGTDEFGLALRQDDPRAPFEPVSITDEFSAESELAADRVSDLREHVRLPRPMSDLLPDDWDAPLEPGPQAGAPATEDAVLPTAEKARPIGSPSPPAAMAPTAGPAPWPGMAPTDHPALAGFEAFLDGAQMRSAVAADPAAALRALGEAFQAMVTELRKAMMARAAIKGEFRIEQTVLRAAGNNPLKFAVDDADALSALLGTGRRGGMSPRRAVADALRDMRLHELAVTAAMQRAVQDLLGGLAPSRIAEQVQEGMLDAMPGRRDARLWRAFEARHGETAKALMDDFDSVFGKSFARAYEAALREADANDPLQEGEQA